MKFRLLAVVATLGIAFSLHAQTAAKSAYVELGGPGLASANFDMRFGKHEAGIGGRIGVGGLSIGGIGAVFIPVGVNYLLGKDNKNYFELGAGVTPVFGISTLSDDEENDNFRSTFGHLLFGYRMQPQHGGFLFRAFISPVFGKGFFVPYYGGVSFGYKFGS